MKKPRTGRPASDNAALLAELLAQVVPLDDHGRVIHPRQGHQPIPHQRLRDERAALADSLSDRIPWELAMETGEEPVFLRDGMARQTLRKLRRGHWVIQDELDLHGLTANEARALLIEFLNQCLKTGARCVRIVHGKGLRSKNREPVLKRKVENWLLQRDEVLAFCQARQADGGSGAMMVLLKGGRMKAEG